MTLTISPERKAFVKSVVDNGTYCDESAVVEEALRLLERQEAFRREVEIGTRQLENGEYTDYDDESLRARFEQIRREGRAKLAQLRAAQS